MKEQLIEKMITFYRGNIDDINHFLKVLSFASLSKSFIVNAGENEKYARTIHEFKQNVFQTSTGLPVKL